MFILSILFFDVLGRMYINQTSVMHVMHVNLGVFLVFCCLQLWIKYIYAIVVHLYCCNKEYCLYITHQVMLCKYKLGGVGPVDNRPSTHKLDHFVKKKYIYIFIYIYIFDM